MTRLRNILSEIVAAWRLARPSSFLVLTLDLILYRALGLGLVPARFQGRRRRIRLRSGLVITYRLTRADIWTVREVWAVEIYRLPFALPSHGGVLLDLGGNIGMAAIYLARLYRFDRVIVVEPESSNVALLRENLAENGIDATVIAGVIGPASGTAAFAAGPERNRGSVVADIRGTQVGVVSVPSFTVDELVPAGGIRLVKFDIEGSEQDLLTANVDWLGRVSALIGEFHPPDVDYPGLIQELEGAGFRFYRGHPDNAPSCDAFLRAGTADGTKSSGH